MRDTGEMGGGELAGLVATGAALLAGLALARVAVRYLPLSRSKRGAVERAAPVLAAFALLLYAGHVVQALTPGAAPLRTAALGLVVGVALAAAWQPVRDIVSGVFLRAGRVCQVGDHVRIDDVKGRVAQMGLRCVAIETSHGEHAIVPYAALVRSVVLRRPIERGAFLHVFVVRPPESAPPAEVRRRIREAALLCHWASAVREPEIVASADGSFEVSVYALDAEHAPDVERAVREALQPRPEVRSSSRPASAPTHRAEA